ncbi:hypothetical protein CBOM_00309 [Ceraceosorus bombacis]|uniref:Uncharacterized protein n=1 Tax=Ceraceosorus bombacis TaxID=401625 RepID=A0A0P1B8P2_9BASI|nr:hypothetical protein CBOM_00309 [Ceraceosorus bombacis]
MVHPAVIASAVTAGVAAAVAFELSVFKPWREENWPDGVLQGVKSEWHTFKQDLRELTGDRRAHTGYDHTATSGTRRRRRRRQSRDQHGQVVDQTESESESGSEDEHDARASATGAREENDALRRRNLNRQQREEERDLRELQKEIEEFEMHERDVIRMRQRMKREFDQSVTSNGGSNSSSTSSRSKRPQGDSSMTMLDRASRPYSHSSSSLVTSAKQKDLPRPPSPPSKSSAIASPHDPQHPHHLIGSPSASTNASPSIQNKSLPDVSSTAHTDVREASASEISDLDAPPTTLYTPSISSRDVNGDGNGERRDPFTFVSPPDSVWAMSDGGGTDGGYGDQDEEMVGDEEGMNAAPKSAAVNCSPKATVQDPFEDDELDYPRPSTHLHPDGRSMQPSLRNQSSTMTLQDPARSIGSAELERKEANVDREEEESDEEWSRSGGRVGDATAKAVATATGSIVASDEEWDKVSDANDA